MRPTLDTDAPALVALHERMSSESVYLRYFRARADLPLEEARATVRAEPGKHMVFGAFLGDEMVACASYDRVGEGEAEVAFAIADAHQGRGIGTLLLEHLAAVAREHGFHRFSAEVLPENHRMLHVFRNAGYEEKSRFHSGSVRTELEIAPDGAALEAIREREWQAEAQSVRRLLHPASIAVVGAGRRPGGVGHAILANLIAGGFGGPLYPIHPVAEEVLGRRAYPSLAAAPGPVDLALVAVPRDEVLGVVRDCGAAGVGSLVVASAGFAETGEEGAALEREVVSAAHRHGMRMIGPNCLGVLNTAPEVRMNATFAPTQPTPGRVGFLSQSGALGIALLGAAAQRGLGISSFASVGNKADLSSNDFLEYWEGDQGTEVVLLYLESFGNPRKFSRVARRVSQGKPIVAVKAGRSAAGHRAASSHTAALASSDTAVDALFLQTGVIRVDTFSEMLDVAELLAHQPLPRGRRIAVVGNSGGPGIMAADSCEAVGLELPELSTTSQARLRDLLPPGAGLHNPVDLIASAGASEYRQALEIVLADESIDALIAIYTLVPLAGADDVARAIAAAAATRPDKPLVAAFIGVGEPRAALVEAGIPCLPFPEPAAAALARAAGYASWRARPRGETRDFPDLDRARAQLIVRRALAEAPQGTWLSPADARELVAAYGAPAVAVSQASDPEEAVRAADSIGYPVVLKAASPSLVHKTDVGGVRLDLHSAGAVREAFESMHAALGPRMGGAHVQRQLPEGVETIVGVIHDPSFGPLIMLGMGGVSVELQSDRAFRILPLTDRDAHELVRAPRAAPLLFGYRGSPPCRTEALEELLLRIAQLAAEVPEIAELDLNPVIVGPEGVAAVDVKVRLEPYAKRTRGLRRLR